MKQVLLVIALITCISSTEKFKKVLCSHPWKVEYIKTINGTQDPNSKLPVSEMYNTQPLCGQVVTFKKDSTCEVKNKGNGMWSGVDEMNWYLDESGNLKFRNKGIQFQYANTLLLLSFNKDSIIFYTPMTGIESGSLSVTLYKLKRTNVNGK